MASQIIIGDELSPFFSFTDDDIFENSIVVNTSINVIGEELESDQFEAEVLFDDLGGELMSLPWATHIYYYFDGILVGKFYKTNVVQTGRSKYKIYATSVYGILDYKKHYGGIWFGEPFKNVVKNIIATNGIARFEQGYYSKVYRGDFGQKDGNAVSLNVLGFNHATVIDTNNLPYSSIMSAKFTLNRFAPECLPEDISYYGTQTNLRIALLGEIGSANLLPGEMYSWKLYGMYMDVSRNSVDDDWGDFGEVFFVYSDYVYSLGTPTEPTTYTVYVDPSNNVATINDVDYYIEFGDGSPDEKWGSLGSYAGGTYFHKTTMPGSSAVGYAERNGLVSCDVVYEYYRLYSPSGELNHDFAIRYDILGDKLYGVDLCTAKGTYSDHYKVNLFFGMVKREDHVSTVDPLIYPLMAIYPTVYLDDFAREFLENTKYENGIDELPVTGWIDICSKREALHQLLFAMGVIFKKDAYGNIMFTYPTNTEDGEIGTDRLFIDGNVEPVEHTNEIEISEFSYDELAYEERQQAYSNPNAPQTGGYYAEFTKRPTQMVEADGINILAQNCNAAYVTGSGSLTSRPYVVGESVVSRKIANYEDGKTVSVTDATLVTLQNSASVADRLENFYGNAKKVTNSFLKENETCGLKYSFENPFNESTSGFLAKMTLKPSSIIKADAEFVCDYEVPSQSGVDYTDYVILTGEGTWTVPQSVFEKDIPRIRVVVIGGGTGGDSGFAGEDGAQGKSGNSQIALGGELGRSGEGGKVYEIVIDSPSASYTYSCGEGGEGGAINTSKTTSNPGSPGTPSTFSDGVNTYSSENGTRLLNGHLNFFSGKILAKSYADYDPYVFNGLKFRGKGGDGGYVYTSDSKYYLGQSNGATGIFGEGVWSGGASGNFYPSSSGFQTTGGCGGGGAVGQNGGNPTNGSSSKAGNGGKGADAIAIPPKITDSKPEFSEYYGYGGCGGYGGGGGGSSGIVSPYSSASAGTPGAGGYGGKGGYGGDGCILIYY